MFRIISQRSSLLSRSLATEAVPPKKRSFSRKFILVGIAVAGTAAVGYFGYQVFRGAFYAYSRPVTPSSSSSTPEQATNEVPEGASKPRLVILGSGWGGIAAARAVDKSKYDVTIVSPRNYFLMTPLLASVAVGTIETRAVCENIRQLFKGAVRYVESEAYDVDIKNKVIKCSSSDPQMITTSSSPVKVSNASSRVVGDSSRSRPISFDVPYDILVVSVGAEVNTFNVPGVEKHAHFLKELKDARRIRVAISDCFESAATPGQSKEERARLLNFVIVGGGPTGIELSAEIYDLIQEDLKHAFPSEAREAKVVVIEALDHILSMYDKRISTYTEEHFLRQNITLLTNSAVKEVKEDGVVVQRRGSQELETIPCAVAVWATGIKPRPIIQKFRQAIGLEKQTNTRALITNRHLQLVGAPDIYAIGDCSTIHQPQLLAHIARLFQEADLDKNNTLDYEEFRAFLRDKSAEYPQLELMAEQLLGSISPSQSLSLEEFQKKMAAADSKLRALPATAQVASQQGHYLAKLFNETPVSELTQELDASKRHYFQYSHLGSLAYIGGDEAIADFSPMSSRNILSWLNLSPLSGWGTYWLWRSVYFSELFTTRNRTQLAFDWTRSKIFGRDISRD